MTAACLGIALPPATGMPAPVQVNSAPLFVDPSSIAYQVAFTRDGVLFVGQGLNYTRAQWWGAATSRPDWETPFGTNASRSVPIASRR